MALIFNILTSLLPLKKPEFYLPLTRPTFQTIHLEPRTRSANFIEFCPYKDLSIQKRRKFQRTEQ